MYVGPGGKFHALFRPCSKIEAPIDLILRVSSSSFAIALLLVSRHSLAFSPATSYLDFGVVLSWMAIGKVNCS